MQNTTNLVMKPISIYSEVIDAINLFRAISVGNRPTPFGERTVFVHFEFFVSNGFLILSQSGCQNSFRSRNQAYPTQNSPKL